MVKALVLAALAWPVILGSAVVARAHDTAPVFASAVYVAGSRICHQRPERSFHSQGVKWPVCGRCSGLYLGGAIGALAWLAGLGQSARPRLLSWLGAAAVPTALTLVLEWTGLAAVNTTARALSGIVLGVMVAVVIIDVVSPGLKTRPPSH